MSELFIFGFMAMVVLAGSAGATVPPIDAVFRGKTETATFALG